ASVNVNAPGGTYTTQGSTGSAGFTVTAGTVILGGSLALSNGLTLTAGTLDAGSNYAITVAGNWTTTHGHFTARQGNVTLNSSVGQGLSSSGSSFYDLVL